jgi:GT2 family glycosyltransferase
MTTEAVMSTGLDEEQSALAQTPPPPASPLRASIIIVAYNARTYLADCLDSLLAEDRPEYEIIVVDNASGDGSAEFVAERYPTVRLVRHRENCGFGHGNNLGAGMAAGKYLAFLNPDTVAEPGWLEELIGALEADTAAGMATSQIRLRSRPSHLNTCGNDTHVTGLTLCRGMGMAADTFSRPAEVSAVSGAAFVIRRDLFDRLGGFDEEFFMYMEDTDLSWRARLAGYRSLYVPSSVVHHDYRLRFGPRKTFWQERNRYLMLLKTLHWRTLAVLAPALLLAEVVTWGFVLLREPHRWRNKLDGYVWLARSWGKIMERRRRTQALRRVSDRDLLNVSTHRLAYEQTGMGPVAKLAHALMDPLFQVFRWLALALTA